MRRCIPTRCDVVPLTDDRISRLPLEVSETAEVEHELDHPTVLRHDQAELLVDVVGKEVGEDGGLRVHVSLSQKRSQALEQRLVRPAKQPCRRCRNALGHGEIVSRQSRRDTLIGRTANLDIVRRQRHVRAYVH